MEAFDAYIMYLGLKRHFTFKSGYDYIKYNGKVNASKTSFETRRDKYSFHKLSKKPEPKDFLVANFVEHGPNIWIGELVAESKYEDTYKNWLKRKEALSYTFKNEVEQLNSDFDSNFKVIDGQYPKLLELYMRKKISLETIIILNGLLNFMPKWNKEIEDQVIWPEIYNICLKYSPFMEYDKTKMLNLITESLW